MLGNPVACPGIAFTKRPLARAGGSRQGRFECLPWALGLILESGGLEFVWRTIRPARLAPDDTARACDNVLVVLSVFMSGMQKIEQLSKNSYFGLVLHK